jgi:hypothetical protein
VTSPLDQQILRRQVFIRSSRADYCRLARHTIEIPNRRSPCTRGSLVCRLVLAEARPESRVTFFMLSAGASVSHDGSPLTQMVKDTTEAETVTIETQSGRVGSGPAGSHTISGTWKAFKASRLRNASATPTVCEVNSICGVCDNVLASHLDRT